MRIIVFIFASLLMLTGCTRHQPSDKPPIHAQQNMFDQPKYKAQAESPYFSDGSAMREPIEGTVARGLLRADSSAYYEGKDADGKLVKRSPVMTSMGLLAHGRQRYDIFCAPCHGRVGNSQSMVVKKGLLPPPSFHEQRLRDTADGHFFDVITNGVRNMPPYKYQISPGDRWAIVAYIRALQRSQNAKDSDVPVEIRPTLHQQGQR